MKHEKAIFPPRFIHFFGPDGAGKSTQVNLLLKMLKSKGIRAKISWIRSPHTLAFFASMLLIRIGFYRVSLTSLGKIQDLPLAYRPKLKKNKLLGRPVSWGGDVNVNPWRDVFIDNKGNVIVCEKIPAIDRSRVLRSFWGLIELVSVLPLILYRVYLQLLRGYVIIAERYVIDTVATIAYFMNNMGFLSSPIATVLLSCIPKKSKLIYLDSNYETIMKRRSYNVEVRSFIQFQRMAYNILAKRLDALIIDTSQFSINETFNAILRNVRLA
jgi:thymidylate kinase